MLSLHKLFLNGDDSRSFHAVIEPTKRQRETLEAAKNAIRGHLRTAIRQASKTMLGMDRMVDPRFRTQGSWAYRTCVQPAHTPPQEMDWDFGVYLPVTVWESNGPPKAMAKLYFDLVEGSLEALCRVQGWSLDRSNSRCVRARIAPWGHIDVPLYAAPEGKFEEIMEKAIASARADLQHFRESAAFDESAAFEELPESFWLQMDDIHVATRDGQWLPSDTEAVTKWFTDRVTEHGEQLRRVCRYLKAWRDYHWTEDGAPSSVLIMIIVAQAFTPILRRDDIAIENAANALAVALRHDVRERGIDDGQEDFNRLSPHERQEASNRAMSLANQLHACRHFGLGLIRDAVQKVRSEFGPRIPDDCGLVCADDGADVRRTPAAVVPPPIVGATRAG